ncbi:MAG: hypothetical protein RXR51_05835 [Nitrososphaeria archaeon]
MRLSSSSNKPKIMDKKSEERRKFLSDFAKVAFAGIVAAPAIVPMIQPKIAIVYIHFEKPIRRFFALGATKPSPEVKTKSGG